MPGGIGIGGIPVIGPPGESITDSGELGGPGGGSCGEVGLGSTVTASWIGLPSSRESAWMTSGRSRVSSCSLTKAFGVAISTVFSTRPSGRVSSGLSQASWLGPTCISASPLRDRAHTSARSRSLTDVLPSRAALPERDHLNR